MEDYGYKQIHKLPQFVTTLNSTKKLFDWFETRRCQKFRLFSILYNKPLQKYMKSKIKIEDGVHIWKYDLPVRKGYKLLFTQEFFENIKLLPENHLLIQKKGDQDEIICVKF